jgi:hypothetical protein
VTLDWISIDWLLPRSKALTKESINNDSTMFFGCRLRNSPMPKKSRYPMHCFRIFRFKESLRRCVQVHGRQQQERGQIPLLWWVGDFRKVLVLLYC